MIAACRIQGEKVLFFVIGLPGPLSDWCEAVVAGLAEALGGRVARTVLPPPEEMLLYRPAAGTLDQVALSLIEDSPAQLVVGARQPDDRLRTALTRVADGSVRAHAPLRRSTRKSANSHQLNGFNLDLRPLARGARGAFKMDQIAPEQKFVR